MPVHVSVMWGGTAEDPFVDLQLSYAKSMRIEHALVEVTDQVELIWPKDRHYVRLQPRMRDHAYALSPEGRIMNVRFKRPEGLNRAELEEVLKTLARKLGWQIMVGPAARRTSRKGLASRAVLAIEPPPTARSTQRQLQPPMLASVSGPTFVVTSEPPPKSERQDRSAKIGKPREVLVGRVKEQEWVSLNITFVRPTRRDAEAVREALVRIGSRLPFAVQSVRRPSGSITVEAQDRRQRRNCQLLRAALIELTEHLQWSVKEGIPQSWT